MDLGTPKNANYAAQVVRVNTIQELGLQNLIGVPVLGHQALTQRDGVKVGDLRIAFTAETQLSQEYAGLNNLFRDNALNDDPAETGYLEKNARIRALKLAGQRSNALLMPLSSLDFAGFDWSELREGDTFDTLNGHEICRKYEIPVKHVHGPARTKVEKAFKRVDKKLFPEHLETDQYWRNKKLVKAGREVVITQKLHGTSIRVGNVPALRQKGWFERLVCKLPGISTPDYEHDVVYGSRKVIKDVNNPNQNHYYQSDIWTEYGAKIANLIPEGYLVYGELIGWTADGTPLQKNYTYHLPRGEAEMYVYRVATVNRQGVMSDLSWDGVKLFCAERGLKWTPELFRLPAYEDELDGLIDNLMDIRFAEQASALDRANPFKDALPLSDKKTVDEGVCLRQEGVVPLILKAKSPKFLEHETKLLDAGEVDTESAEAVA